MHARSLIAHLAHLAQDGDARPLAGKHRHQIEAGSHGLGAGIIRIIHDARARGGMAHLHATARHGERSQGIHDRLGADSQAPGDGHGEQGIGDRLGPRYGYAHRHRIALLERKGEMRVSAFVEFDPLGSNGIGRRRTAAQDLDAGRASKRLLDKRREIVLAMQHEHRGMLHAAQLERSHARDDLGLGTCDILAASQDTDMRGTDLGDDGEIRSCARGQPIDLVEMVHSHFQHHDLRIGRRRQNGEGQTYEIVVIALGCVDAPGARQQRRHDILGSGLADRPGDAHHEGAQSLSIPGGEAQKELGGVISHHKGAARNPGPLDQVGCGLDRHDDAAGTGIDGLRGERVAVNTLPGKRHEDVPL